jgi:deoxyadenosine/deoxycytidine kinase
MTQVIVIEGTIAAGKSTLVKFLAKCLRSRGFVVAVAPEPVKKWEEIGALAAFYNDPVGMAYSFQSYVCMTRIRSICDAYDETLEQHGRVDYLISERSPYTDKYVFMRLQAEAVGELHMAMYDNWWSEWMRLVPDAVRAAAEHGKWHEVWLQSGTAECMQRLASRGRTGEIADPHSADEPAGGVTELYQDQLFDAHRAFLGGDGVPIAASVILIPPDIADRNFRDDESLRDKALGCVLEGIGLE